MRADAVVRSRLRPRMRGLMSGRARRAPDAARSGAARFGAVNARGLAPRALERAIVL